MFLSPFPELGLEVRSELPWKEPRLTQPVGGHAFLPEEQTVGGEGQPDLSPGCPREKVALQHAQWATGLRRCLPSGDVRSQRPVLFSFPLKNEQSVGGDLRLAVTAQAGLWGRLCGQHPCTSANASLPGTRQRHREGQCALSIGTLPQWDPPSVRSASGPPQWDPTQCALGIGTPAGARWKGCT